MRAGISVIAATLSIGNTAIGASDASDWAFLGGNSQSQQYSALTQINAKNVTSLGLWWYSDLPVKEGLVGNPLVKDGFIYQSAPRGGAIATNVSTGKTVWSFLPDFDFSGYTPWAMWMAHATRGIGLDENNVYVTGGCELYAVDRRTGAKVWETRACDPSKDVGIIPAPRVGGGKVFVGSNNAELGTNRGFAAAFDAKTGKELWRFYTVPGDPTKPYENKQMELAAKTWGDDYWVKTRGAAAVWDGMTYDPQTNLLYFGAGNPGIRGAREQYADKELLYSDSLIAVNASTGQYVWHFQYVQGDVWDFGDGAAHIIVADLPFKSGPRHVVMQAAKDGFFYVFDARTGQFISANNYVPVTNYYPMDPKTGKLRVRDEVKYWEHPGKQVILEPGGWGAHTWELSSYNPVTGLVYIPCFIFPNVAGRSARGKDSVDDTGAPSLKTPKAFGRLVAWDPIAERERWHVDHPVVINGGVLSTAGRVVFQGTPDGKFYAYDATDGKLLWSFETHAIVEGGPSTVMVDGKQVILVPSGDGTGGVTTKYSSRISTTPETISAPSRLLAFALGGTEVLPPSTPKALLRPALPPQPTQLANRGKRLFAMNNCGACHDHDLIMSDSSYVPDLRNIRAGTLQIMRQIVRDGAYKAKGMPQFSTMTDEDIRALKAYIINSAWAAYGADKVRTQQREH